MAKVTKVVFTAAVMDLFHEGHANLLRAMRAEAGPDGLVVVMLHSDHSTWLNKKRFPAQALDHRMQNLKMTDLASAIHPVYRQFPAFETIPVLYPAAELLFMRGDDWPDFPGRGVLEALKIPMKIIPYTAGVSSSAIRSGLKPDYAQADVESWDRAK